MGGGFQGGVNARMPGVKITLTDSSSKCKKKMVTERDSTTLGCFFLELRLQESSHGFLDASGQV